MVLKEKVRHQKIELEQVRLNHDHQVELVTSELQQVRVDHDHQIELVKNLTAKVERLEAFNKSVGRDVENAVIRAAKLEETCSSQRDEIKNLKYQLATTHGILKVQTTAVDENKNHNKECVFQNNISSQLQSLKDLRTTSQSLKLEIFNFRSKCTEDLHNIEIGIKDIKDSADNYHIVLEENRKLFNELQELKGNIRVYCRVRPFLPAENPMLTTIDRIGENGELVLMNPSREGEVAHRLFKFNKVFGPTASQDEVFLDIKPLIRSVLDGYIVCIFAYGQTGSGKTYTMNGPDSLSEEERGINYRALNDLFHISQVHGNAYKFDVNIQMVQIYNEQVFDLLSGSSKQYPLLFLILLINAKH